MSRGQLLEMGFDSTLVDLAVQEHPDATLEELLQVLVPSEVTPQVAEPVQSVNIANSAGKSRREQKDKSIIRELSQATYSQDSRVTLPAMIAQISTTRLLRYNQDPIGTLKQLTSQTSLVGKNKVSLVSKAKVESLTDMGFSREKAFEALSQTNGDVEQAATILLT